MVLCCSINSHRAARGLDPRVGCHEHRCGGEASGPRVQPVGSAARGVERFVARARDSGVDGVIVVDYPPEEATGFAALLRDNGIAPIFLVAPTTPDARIERIAKLAAGYVYYVSLKGVTGAGHLDTDAVARKLAEVRRHLSLPVGVGFGIRDEASARAIAAHADAVVIGSRIINEIENGGAAEAASRAGAFVATIRRALDTRELQPAA